MTFIPGNTLTETISLTDSSNTPIVGASFTTLLTADPDGNAFSLSYTGMVNGAYRFEVATTASSPTGNWFALVRASDALQQIFTLQWTVTEADQPRPYYVGQTLVDTIVLVDAQNDPITGAAFSLLSSRDPNGAALAYTVTELGNGAYRVTVDGDNVTTDGSYFILLQADDTLSQVFEVEWFVSSATAIIYSPPPNGMSRRDLRRAILEELGDLVLTTATASTGSSQWEDVDRLSFGDSSRYAGRELYVTRSAGNNAGQLRAIEGSNGQGRLQLTRALPDSVVEGDEAEIVNTYGMGVTIDRVHRSINTALMEAQVDVRASATISDAFDVTTRSFDIPPQFTAVDGLHYTLPTDSATQGIREVQHAKTMGSLGWYVDRANRRVYIGGYPGLMMDGGTITLRGWGTPPPLETDDDIAPIHPEWIIAEVASALLLRSIGTARSISPEWERKGFFLAQKAERLRDTIRPRRSPNYTKL